MDLEGNSNSGTSAAFLDQLRQRHSGPLQVIWDNALAHRGEAVREYLRRPGLGLRLVNLPGYSPDFNADEAIWGWAREEATGNLCLGSRAAVQERVGSFLARLTSRKDEVKRRCRTVLQSRAESLLRDSQPRSPTSGKCTSHLGFGLGAIWRLNEMAMLPEIGRYSSVSGGSILAGLMAVQWPRLDFRDGVAVNFTDEIFGPIWRFCSRNIDRAAVLFGLVSGTWKLEQSYRKHLVGEFQLRDLPDYPDFVFNAVHIKTGRNCTLSKKGTAHLAPR